MTSKLLTKVIKLDLNSLSKLPVELARVLINAYDQNPRINAFTSLISVEDASKAYEQAPTNGSMRGIPIAIKDVFCTHDLPTTASSRILENYQSPFEATVVSRLRSAGAIVVGKTNMDEFGMGSANLNSHFGPTVNPVASFSNPGEVRVAGGSSGGSAAAVASGMCRIALGSDTGGSTRLPAAYCGVVGLKPSYGLLSRFGMIAYASSLDCVGIMAKNVADVRLAFNTMSFHDAQDPTSISEQSRKKAKSQEKDWSKRESLTDLTGLRIGVPLEYFLAELSPSVLPNFRRVLRNLQSMGATLSSVSIPSTPNALSAYYVIASAEACSNLARYDGMRFGTRFEADSRSLKEGEERLPLYSETRSAGFGREVQKRLLLGTHALSAEAFDNYFLQAQRVRHLLQLEFNDIFSNPHPLSAFNTSNTLTHSLSSTVDLLIHPSSISTAPLASSSQTSTESYVQDVLNVPSSLAGLPALSVPAGVSENDGMPVGVQLVGQWGSEDLVLRVGEAIMDFQGKASVLMEAESHCRFI